MRAEVRDDIIKLETFVAIKFKYEKYIDILHEAGGYCFLSQFAYHYGNTEGRYIAKQLEDTGLIKTKAISNYKYCYLTDAAIKYLKLKDNEEDYSEKSKNEINVKRLSIIPSDKVLFASAIKFALMHKYKFIGKKHYEKNLVKAFSELYKCNETKVPELKDDIAKLKEELNNEVIYAKKIVQDHINPLFQIYNGDTKEEYKNIKNKIDELESLINEKNKSFLPKNLKKEEDEIKDLKIRLAELGVIKNFKESLIKQSNDLKTKINTKNEYIEEKKKELKLLNIEMTEKAVKVREAVKRVVSYYDKSKIIFTLSIKSLALNMLIIDTGTLKNPYGYIDVLNKFSSETGTKNLSKNFFIASHSKKRAEKLKEDLNKILIEKKNKLKKAEDYERKINMSNYTPEFYKNAQSFINRIPDFTITILDYAHYMESYKETVSSKIGYIKPKDKDRFEEIKNNLKMKSNFK